MVTLDEGGWAAAAAQLAPVPGALLPYVEQLFVIDFRDAAQTSWKILPDTCGHLLVSVERDRVRTSVVGARSRATVVDVSGRHWSVGARLRPGALAAVTGDAADRLTDRSASPGAVWGSVGDRLTRELAGASDPTFVRDRVTAALLALAARSRSVDWRGARFAALARRSAGATRVSDAAEVMGVAPRTLRAATRAHLGLPPKRYARVQRLLHALHLSSTGPWTEVAFRAGFADQAHLTREFRDLVGETPTSYVSRGLAMPIRSSGGAERTQS